MAIEALVSEEMFAPVPGPNVSTVTLVRQRERIELGGVLIDRVDGAGAVEQLRKFLMSGKSHQVVTVNLDFLSIAQRNARFRRTLNTADLAVADGMPLVWASRLRGEALPERVAGVDLVNESCRLAAESGESVFLLGAAPGVAEAAARKLEEAFPGLRIAGTYSPPIGPISRKENLHILSLINKARPGFLFVALGAPRQDLWIRDNREQLEVQVCMGVGCVFDVLAGTVVRAPRWMQRTGLEWAYRLCQEPGRLWRRYLLNDSLMFGRLIFESASGQRSEGPLAVPTT
jgi:N-acetylglucosaminyldiphosphoundecaprenol N-acetyl-beta-D-mannosaminyltransferase